MPGYLFRSGALITFLISTGVLHGLAFAEGLDGRLPSAPSDPRYLILLNERTASADLSRNAFKRVVDRVSDWTIDLFYGFGVQRLSRAARPVPAHAVPVSADDHRPASFAAGSDLAREKLRIWQERLGFLNWNLRIAVVPEAALHRHTVGDLQWQQPGTAWLRAMDVSSYNSECAFRADMEDTIVHELVHLHLAFEPRMQKRGTAEEQVVEEITEAILRLDGAESFAACP